MSDLISRSELIKIIKGTDELLDFQKDECIICINACDIAYDIDKVVEELDKAKDEIASEDYCRSINDKEKCDSKNCFKCCAEYLIEIVKQGGVETNQNRDNSKFTDEDLDKIWDKILVDDCCEWVCEDKNDAYPYHTSCGFYFEYDVDFVYCPVCRKKIKVVE